MPACQAGTPAGRQLVAGGRAKCSASPASPPPALTHLPPSPAPGLALKTPLLLSRAGPGAAQVPKAWREELKAAGVRTGRSVLHHQVVGSDGTTKLLLQLQDGRVVETVGIPTRDRLTVCVSSQVRAVGAGWGGVVVGSSSQHASRLSAPSNTRHAAGCSAHTLQPGADTRLPSAPPSHPWVPGCARRSAAPCAAASAPRARAASPAT